MEILFGEYGGLLLRGTLLSLQLALIGFLGAMVLGTILAMFRVSPIPPLRAFGGLYVEFFRNVPMVTLMILVVYGLPYAGVNLGQFWSVIAAIITVGAAFACETIRTGINAVSAGQVEAARAIGLTFWGISKELVVPQAVRSVISPLVTLFIGILLSSSLAAVVGMRELTATAGYINNKAALGLLTFGVIAVIYMVISLVAAGIGILLERRFRVLR
ncbi:glutamate transport system permease protein [Salana multivorans]|uniref:Glutamate transport system permease protein n=1 Tax=Salana multivorans TaxID=120377 RepID=A0A3N2DAM3_9MICO|nr:amino acid ABC transporter permease [Salana multivorans]MBN8882792.1 amino acid ABC transporter permease [Salana multivorans]OJX96995.1 MAG: amino acid ABC transporter permease [Micrococcales bacterium 73-15]ROR96851.1 glutamate transport system permease protein [Salana multivorans]